LSFYWDASAAIAAAHAVLERERVAEPVAIEALA